MIAAVPPTSTWFFSWECSSVYFLFLSFFLEYCDWLYLFEQWLFVFVYLCIVFICFICFIRRLCFRKIIASNWQDVGIAEFIFQLWSTAMLHPVSSNAMDNTTLKQSNAHYFYLSCSLPVDILLFQRHIYIDNVNTCCQHVILHTLSFHSHDE